ncbi:MAG: hypothetical protein BWK76_23005 [Desulfobulbaceae bacterium A2]|nr:MAG: hypothetical protein BWK76_23005 [Desulfobulbaceae bacterium A2]
MKDIQSLHDDRRIDIRKVGVKTISYPITLLDKARSVQHTVATVNMYVNLPHRFKGTHMSRFVEILNGFHGGIDLKGMRRVLLEMKQRLEAEEAHLEIAFPYFCAVPAGEGRLVQERYDCRMHGSLAQVDDLLLQLRLPLAPPPRAAGGTGLPRSPGRWGFAEVAVRCGRFLWIEDLVAILRRGLSAGSPGGREEGGKETAEERMTVESITERLGWALARHPAIAWFSLTVENLAEGYTTFATLEGP